MPLTRRHPGLAVIAAGLAWLIASAPARAAQAEFPGAQWAAFATPREAGYDGARLAAVRRRLETMDTTALMVVVNGRVLLSYGDTAHVSYLASVRKSVLAMLYGRYVAAGVIDLSRTLADLNIDDVQGLTPAERRATVRDLLTARSGVYHPAANPGDDLAHAPPRGSVAPGSQHLYNNWDFNAAGSAFEQLTGVGIYEALERDLARPIGMQDFSRERQRKTGDLTRSRHAAYHMWLSTRDMARLGLLMLREGRWREAQVLPPQWAARIVTLETRHQALVEDRRRRFTRAGEHWGYGHMWWVWDAAGDADVMTGAYAARGLGGQFITVIPRLDMVIAHKTDIREVNPVSGQRRRVTAIEHAGVVRELIAARCAARCD